MDRSIWAWVVSERSSTRCNASRVSDSTSSPPSSLARTLAVRLPPRSNALRQLTLVWCAASFAKAGVGLWLLTWLPLETFLVVVSAFQPYLNFSLLGLSCWWALRAIRLARA
jgi:hypothetical protein